MPEIFFDTHAHLDYPDFATELIPVVERASGAGISRIITIGTDLESSRRSIQIAEQFPNVFAVVGWHPSYAMNAPADLDPRCGNWPAIRKSWPWGRRGWI